MFTLSYKIARLGALICALGAVSCQPSSADVDAGISEAPEAGARIMRSNVPYAYPVGPAGGDLGGTYANPSVAKVQGTSAKSGTPSIWSQWTYNPSTTQWEGRGAVSATLTDANVTVDCALSVAGTLNASQFVLPAATLSAGRTMTINTDSAVTGESISVVRFDTTANTYAIVNGGSGGGTMITLPASKARAANFAFNGTDWVLVAVNSVN